MLRGKDGDTTMAILYADLDEFKEVNERYGHEIGDRLLVAVAERLKTILHTTDTLARLASDEFVILCEDVTDPTSIEPFASFLGDTLAAPFVLGELEVLVTASVGIAVVGPAQLLPEVVLRDAGTAMSQAKKRGGANHGTLDRVEQQLGVERATLLRDLRGALARSELLVEYQPIVSTSDGSVRGAEALLRWDHPQAGRIRPDVFIPLAETCGAIVPIGSWVMDRACRDRDTWQRPGERPIELAVNVSAHQFVSPGFVASVAEILDTTGIPPELLTLEVTESIFLQDGALAVAVFDQLKGLGVRLSLDDFGTGYSSLSYLSRFPIDTVKIDRSFVVQLAAPTTHLIIAAVVDLAHGMDMDIIAEGVETEKELDAVRELGCDFYQGYYFAASMPTEAFRARIG
jgi:diguanylate cyclase (GGDEF)-like protein